MCGIVAVITKNTTGFNQAQKDAFKLLLWLDQLRGEDSTGVITIENDGNVHIAKEAVDAHEFSQKKEFHEIVGKAWSRGFAMVGHNRKATRGSITDENAHPFWVEDKLVLVHNGSYNGSHKHLKDVEVDSNAIAHHLADAGSEPEDIEKALKHINAAYALVWYDIQNKRLNFIRNTQRPLCVMETNDAIYLASEGSMLRFASERLGLKPVEKNGGPFLLKEHQLVTIQLKDNKQWELEANDLDCAFVQPKSQPNYNSVFPHHVGRPYLDPRACGWTGFGMDDCADAYGAEGGCADDVPFRDIPNDLGDTDADHTAAYAAHKLAEAVKEAAKETEGKGKKGATIYGTQPSVGERHIAINKVLEMKKPEWNNQLFAKYEALKGMYQAGQKIKVVISDLVEADDNPKTDTFFMLGIVQDSSRLPVSFKMKDADFAKISHSANDAVFEVEVDSIHWATVDLNGSTDMSDWKGLMLIHAKNPKAIDQPKDTYVH